MSSIHGLEKSAVSAHLYPIACVFPCCRMMIWGELETILSFLTLSEIYKGIGCASRAGCLAYERECNIRIGEHNRVLARYCTRSDWQTTLDKMGVIVSYPRSGNTFMRLLMEQTSGLCTGSDSRPNRNLAASLLRSGFRGEGIVDSSVWTIKTHYPERLGYLAFHAYRAVLVIRNPFDALLSYFHMGMTNTHDRVLHTKNVFSAPCIQHLWLEFVIAECQVWVRFHRYWQRISKTIPVLLIRFEDMLCSAEEMSRKTLLFLQPKPGESERESGHAGNEQVEEDRGKQGGGQAATAQLQSLSLSSRGGYKPKKDTTIVGKALEYLPSDIIIQMLNEEGMQELMETFGYSIVTDSSALHSADEGDIAGTGIGTDIGDGCDSGIGSSSSSSGASNVKFKVVVHPIDNEKFLSQTNNHSSATSSNSKSNINSDSTSKSCSSRCIVVNDTTHSYTVRMKDDRFGRRITELRHSLTNKDTRPFELEER